MSKNKDYGGKSDRDGHEDHGAGDKGIKLKGTSGDDVLPGTSRSDFLSGGKGNDYLDGGAGNDLLIGGQGNDTLLGGSGDDVIYGDKGKSGWGWNDCFWWKPHSSDDDYTDGGAGNDRVFAGKGDDVILYSMAGNLGAGFKNIGTHDFYDGGSGFDTLQLALTYGELRLASVQQDIAAFQAFLDHKANPHSDDGKTFEFKTFNLDAKNFEALSILKVNTGPTARGDSGATDEDTQLVVAGPGVLANDTDPDHLDVLSVVAGRATSAMGAVVQLNADGSYSYNPRGALALQQLGEGESATDSFSYSITDLAGATATATVQVNVTGVNDAPVAVADAYQVAEDMPLVVAGPGVLTNDTDVEGNALQAALVSGPAHGAVSFNIDGSFSYLANADFNGDDSFTYRASDGLAGSAAQTVSIKVTEVNDAPVAAADAVTLAEDGSANAFNVLANDSAGPANESGQTLSVSAASALHGSVLINADGTLSYTPQANYFGGDTISYSIVDDGTTNGVADPLSAAAQVAVTVNPVNDAPVANDDDITGGSGASGPIHVAVVGGNASSYVAAAAQLNDEANSTFDLDADAILVTAFATKAEWTAVLAGYDVVVVGDSGLGDDFGVGTQLFAALHDFVDAGGGVITTGWFEYVLPLLDVSAQSDADYITPIGIPIAPEAYEYVRAGGAITLVGPAHDITAGVTDYAVNALLHELAPVVDAGATVLATGVSAVAPGRTLPAIAYDEVGQGLTVYLGSLHMASSAYAPDGTRGGGADQIFEQAVAWAAGERSGSLAATDEHTPRTISSATLLTNDTDVEGDALSVVFVTAFSSLGATVSLNADGNVVYDPSAALQGLEAGEIVTDVFGYTVSDGNGGFDSALVSLTVAGLAGGAAGGGSGNESKVVVDSVSPGTELEYYIRFDEGSSPEWLRLDHFGMGLSNSGSLGGGAGGGAGKASAEDISALLGSSQTLVELTGALASGKHLKSVEIEAYQPGGDKGAQLVDQYYFEDVLLTGLQTEGKASSTSNDVSFDFAKFNHGHVDYDKDGSKGPVTEDGFDFQANKDADGFGPSIGGDAIKAKLDDALPTDVHLKYYVTFEGAGGWLELDSFSMGLSASGSIGSGGGGGGAGKVSVNGIDLGLGSSAQLLQLSEGVTSGKHFKDLEVEAYRIGEEKQLVDQYVFQDVLVTSLQSDGANNNQVSVEVGRFSHGHVDYDADGSKGDTTSAGWDFLTNKAFTAPVDAGFGKGTPLDSVSPGTELEYYIRFDEGSSPEWLRLDHFGMGLSNSGSLGGGAGGGAGKASAEDISALLGSSQTLVELTGALASGKHLKSVEIEAYQPGGDKGAQLVDQYYFEDVLLTGLQTEGKASSTSNDVSFDFAKFNHGHVDYDKDGSKGPVTEDGFDFQANKDADGFGPSIGGDAIKAKLDDALPTDVHLKYYVTFEGAGGWLELDSFSMGLSASGSIGSGGGGGGAGKVSVNGIDLGLGSSAQLLQLSEGVTSGKHFKDLEVEAYRIGEEKQLVDQYVFQDVLVTSLQSDGANNNQVSVEVGRFSHGHVDYDADGSKGDTTSAGWDFLTNKAFTAPVDAGFGKGTPLDSVSPGTELEYYIRFDEGSSPEWLRLDHFGMGLSNSGSLGGGAGGGAGKASAEDISALLGSSQTLVELTGALASGKHLKSVEIEAYQPGGDKGAQLVDQYYFEDVLLTGLQTEGKASSTSNDVSFDFAKFNHGHVDYDKDGSKGPVTEDGFDFQANKDADGFGPSIGGDAIKAKLDDALPTDVHLKYYVTFEGAGGWLELDSFSMGLSASGSISSGGGGGGAGKVSVNGIDLGLGSSAQLLQLSEGVTSGKHFKDLEVEAYRIGEEKQLVDQYVFQDVLVTSLQSDGANNNQVSVEVGRFSHGHVDYDADGSKGDTTSAGWDFLTNKAFTAPVDSDVF